MADEEFAVSHDKSRQLERVLERRCGREGSMKNCICLMRKRTAIEVQD
jgi:hypothetical protein